MVVPHVSAHVFLVDLNVNHVSEEIIYFDLNKDLNLSSSPNFFRFIELYNFVKDTSPCDSSPCLNNGFCIANPNTCTYSCQCPPGFTGSCCGQGKENDQK